MRLWNLKIRNGLENDIFKKCLQLRNYFIKEIQNSKTLVYYTLVLYLKSFDIHGEVFVILNIKKHLSTAFQSTHHSFFWYSFEIPKSKCQPNAKTIRYFIISLLIWYLRYINLVIFRYFDLIIKKKGIKKLTV